MFRLRSLPVLIAGLLSLLLISGCGGSDAGGRIEFINIGTAPAAGSFHPIGSKMATIITDHAPEGLSWDAHAKGTKGSQENIRLLAKGELQLALSNSSISYFGARGESGWEDAYPIRTVMTLVPNVAMFITRANSNVKTMADLKGKNVVVGPPGAGFEMFVGPILEEHGIQFSDFNAKNMGQQDAVSALGDGSADAAFLGGSIPTTSISQACSQFDVHFIPFEEDAKARLIEKYPFFESFRNLTSTDYEDIEGEFPVLNVGSMHLLTIDTADEELIYQLTKTLYENLDELKAGHASLNSLTKEDIVRNTGIEFHPGAIRFYKEIGIWTE